jgi:hypothetical protein
MKYTDKRKGIALFTAIAFLLVIATLMGLMVSMTTMSSKRGADIYFQEQAQLLAKSATEHALLAISGHEHNSTTGCITNIESSYIGVYDINTTIRYFGLAGYGGTCAGDNSIADNIETPESNATVIIDVYVTVPTAETGSEPIRFHRRTIQKP